MRWSPWRAARVARRSLRGVSYRRQPSLTKPIAAYAASQHVEIVATDLPPDAPRAEEWLSSGEHARQIEDIDPEGICPRADLERYVTFRDVDMREIPTDLRGFDFTWSSCALEHLGSHEAGLEFLRRQLDCLKPGGIGVHTTEYNVDPDGPPVVNPYDVMYQRSHLEAFADEMRRKGHRMKITFALGMRPEDLHVDRRPFTNTHLRTETYGCIHTSFGLVIRRSARRGR